MSESKVWDTANGVKPRYDKGGTAFGDAHRDLGTQYLMFDVDKMSATVEQELELRKENQVFIEYRHSERISFVAIFEYKRNKSQYTLEALDKAQSVSRARLALAQALSARLFVVYADNGKSPFDFYEIDTASGNYTRLSPLYYEKGVDDPIVIQEYWRDVLKITRSTW